MEVAGPREALKEVGLRPSRRSARNNERGIYDRGAKSGWFLARSRRSYVIPFVYAQISF
jgi:hypothetical protein